MADSSATLLLVIKAKDLASKQVGRLGDSFDRTAKKSGRLKSSLVTLAKVGVFGLVTAFVAAAGVIANAVQAAVEEEKSINRLNAALKANVKGWNGNTDAIEALITKREQLAFSDDEQRQSLGTLVVATRNVEQAQKLQAIAMDVARLKTISLDDASKLLIKAQMGNTRALKELGIELPKNATKTQILAAIQKKAAGQADAYGKTSAAAMTRFNNSVDNLMEDLGKELLPLLTQLAEFGNKVVVPAIRNMANWFDDLVNVIQKAADRMNEFWRGAESRSPTRLGGVGGKVQGRAVGGPAHGPTLVGERGPEIVNLPRSFVTPNNQLPRAAANQTIVLMISGKEVGRVVVPEVSRQMFYELQRAAPTLSRT